MRLPVLLLSLTAVLASATTAAAQSSCPQIGQTRSGRTVAPIARAVCEGSVARVRTLLDAGANPNGGTYVPGWSLLHLAASQGHTDVARLLLERGAKPNREYHLKTPLQTAVRHGHVGVVRVLLEHGADVSDVALLGIAVESGNSDVVRLLLAQGTYGGSHHLEEAERKGHEDIVRQLRGAGALTSAEYSDLVTEGRDISTRLQPARQAALEDAAVVRALEQYRQGIREAMIEADPATREDFARLTSLRAEAEGASGRALRRLAHEHEQIKLRLEAAEQELLRQRPELQAYRAVLEERLLAAMTRVNPKAPELNKRLEEIRERLTRAERYRYGYDPRASSQR